MANAKRQQHTIINRLHEVDEIAQNVIISSVGPEDGHRAPSTFPDQLTGWRDCTVLAKVDVHHVPVDDGGGLQCPGEGTAC